MKRVSDMVLDCFKRGACPAAVLAVGLVLVSPMSLASEKKACVAGGCEALAQNEGELGKIRREAAKGDAAAQLALGMRFLMGNGLAADEAAAQEWFLKSALQHNAVAQVSLATMLSFESDRQDLSAATGWFEKSAQAGNVQAMSELVRVYESGRGVDRDMAKAAEWRQRLTVRSEALRLERIWKMALSDGAKWLGTNRLTQGVASGNVGGVGRAGAVFDAAALVRAADNGDDQAQTVLGGVLATGEKMTLDRAAARGWFEKAARSGNGKAMAVLSELTALGWGGLKKDESAAARWMEKAALEGVAFAQAEWGSMLMEGKGVKKDPVKGLSWLALAAQEGDGRARLKMGMVMLGEGKRDAAAKWFEGAAIVGDDGVLSALGAFYGWGDGPVYGESEKLTEVRRYAQRDEPEAQQMMGLLYGEGWGVERDVVKAEYWFDKAAANGDSEVWLPLGLLYAETGRRDKAVLAFDKAVSVGGFALAKDGELLQLVFEDSDKLPDLGSALKRPASARKTDAGRTGQGAVGKSDGQNVNGVSADERRVRVMRKRAFLQEEATRGNPAAQLMLAKILAQGWGGKKDAPAAASLHSDGVMGMCQALKDKAEDEALCSRDGGDSGEAVLPADASGKGTVAEDSAVLTVR